MTPDQLRSAHMRRNLWGEQPPVIGPSRGRIVYLDPEPPMRPISRKWLLIAVLIGVAGLVVIFATGSAIPF
jgi:hypothetical protein